MPKAKRDSWPPDLKRRIAELLIEVCDYALDQESDRRLYDLGVRAEKLLDRIGL